MTDYVHRPKDLTQTLIIDNINKIGLLGTNISNAVTKRIDDELHSNDYGLRSGVYYDGTLPKYIVIDTFNCKKIKEYEYSDIGKQDTIDYIQSVKDKAHRVMRGFPVTRWQRFKSLLKWIFNYEPKTKTSH